MGVFMVLITYLFDIGHLNILQDSHKYLVQYMFSHFHRQGHIWLRFIRAYSWSKWHGYIQLRLNIVYMGKYMEQI